MAATAGRVICSRCGANNFATQAACWKCGMSLVGGPVTAPRPAMPPSAAPGTVASPGPAAPPVFATPADRPDPAVAIWAAVALAVLFPYIAVPVGIVFLMLDDRRKAEIGRATLIWGIIATIAHTLVTFLLISASVQQSMALVQGLVRARAAASGQPDPGSGGLSLPGLSTPPAGRSLPNVPSVPSYENVPFPDPPAP